MNELYSQNSKLSVLAAALMDKLKDEKGNVLVTKEAMEKFKGYRLQIKWELPEGVEKPEDAAEYLFSYTAKLEGQAVPENSPQPDLVTQCSDPNCALPKDLTHSHDTPADVLVAETQALA